MNDSIYYWSVITVFSYQAKIDGMSFKWASSKTIKSGYIMFLSKEKEVYNGRSTEAQRPNAHLLSALLQAISHSNHMYLPNREE